MGGGNLPPTSSTRATSTPTYWADRVYQLLQGGTEGQTAYDVLMVMPIDMREQAYLAYEKTHRQTASPSTSNTPTLNERIHLVSPTHQHATPTPTRVDLIAPEARIVAPETRTVASETRTANDTSDDEAVARALAAQFAAEDAQANAQRNNDNVHFEQTSWDAKLKTTITNSAKQVRDFAVMDVLPTVVSTGRDIHTFMDNKISKGAVEVRRFRDDTIIPAGRDTVKMAEDVVTPALTSFQKVAKEAGKTSIDTVKRVTTEQIVPAVVRGSNTVKRVAVEHVFPAMEQGVRSTLDFLVPPKPNKNANNDSNVGNNDDNNDNSNTPQ